MSGTPITLVKSGGVPVTVTSNGVPKSQVDNGEPMTPVENGEPISISALSVGFLGEGFIYDHRDMTSLYKENGSADAQISRIDDPVALILNKKGMGTKTAAQYINDQPERVSNGDFSDGLTNWNDGSSTGGYIAVVDGALNLVNDTGSSRSHNPFALEDGVTYRLTCTVSGKACSCYHGGSESVGTLDIGDVEVFFVANANFNGIHFRNFTTGTTSIVDNVSLKAIPGQHLIQETASQRPLYQADGTILTDGVDDNMKATVSGFTDECTLAIDFVYQGGTGSFDWPIALNNGTGAEEFGVYINPARSAMNFKISSGGSNIELATNIGTINIGDQITLICSLNGSDITCDIYKNGSFRSTETKATAVGVPTITQLQLATAVNSNKVGGNFGRCAVFNTALTANERALVAQWMLES